MAASIKLSDDMIALLRRESAIANRSLAGQAEHWITLGRAIERSPEFDYTRVRAALAAELSPGDLSEAEQTAFFDEFGRHMDSLDKDYATINAERRRKGLGVGDTENGQLAKQLPNGQIGFID